MPLITMYRNFLVEPHLMNLRSIRPWAAACVAWVAILSFAFAARSAELEQKFRAAKPKLLQDLNSFNPTIRGKALKMFEEFPIPDAANTLLVQAEASRYSDIRRGCLQVLCSYRNFPAVGKELFERFIRELKPSKVERATAYKLMVLLTADDPAVKELADKGMAQLEKSPHAVPVLIVVVDSLAELADGPSVQVLLKLAEHPLAAAHHGFKRAIVQALCKCDEKKAVARLVEFHLNSHGETRADIERRLQQLSGLAGEDNPDWSNWWTRNQETLVFPNTTTLTDLGGI
jgi:hypothetical protein